MESAVCEKAADKGVLVKMFSMVRPARLALVEEHSGK
jgi:hypothetical protein